MALPMCGAKTRTGTPCRQAAGHGTPTPGFGRCRLHGGLSPSGRQAAERQFAAKAVQIYGLPVDVNPVDALHEELGKCNGHVAWLGELIAAMTSRDELRQKAFGDGIAWEKPSVWVELYEQERKHLVEVAETCARLGLDTRRVLLAEGQGEQIAGVIRGVLFDLGVDAADDLPAIVRKHLMAVNGAGDPSRN